MKSPVKVIVHHHSLYGRMGSAIRVKKQGAFGSCMKQNVETFCFTPDSPIIPQEFRTDLDFCTIADLEKEIW